MAKYVALLRGIGPGNPNMQNAKLRGVLENLGLSNVQSVISSGNILFESDETNTRKLEALIEEAWPVELGFESTTIIRSQSQLERLISTAPFNDLVHSPNSYLMVTFFKTPRNVARNFPLHVPEKPYYFITGSTNEICSVTDNTIVKTTDLMSYLEKQFGKAITSRTWLTVHRILRKMNEV